MSNPELVGGWNEYQRLVLAELERHNQLLQTIDDRIGTLKLEIELLKQQKKDMQDLREQVRKNTDRLAKLESGEEMDDALKKYRNWIVGLLFIFITALLLPVINLIFNAFGGG